MGTAGEGVALFRNHALAGRIVASNGLADGVVWSLYAAAGDTLYVGTHRGVYRWADGRLKAIHAEGDRLRGRTYHISRRRDGNLLFGTYDGLFVHDGKDSRLLYEDPIPRRAIIYDVCEARDGSLHLATRVGAVTWRNGAVEYPAGG